MKYDVIIVGGGAAGFFSAICCAERNPKASILILEQSKRVLEKVKISGGGRCNVTHACFTPKELILHYPRGNKALLGPFHRFMCGDMLAWLEERGVNTKIEEDGRIFPTSNQSQTIIDCFMGEIERLNIELKTQCKVKSFKTEEKAWVLESNQGAFLAKNLLIATGSSKSMWEQIKRLGHQIEKPVPSLFTFNINNKLLRELPGLSVKNGTVKVLGTKLKESGPVLITHWGLSGPGILKLSAWGARILNEKDYHFTIAVNWTAMDLPDIRERLKTEKSQSPRRKVMASPLFDLPKRLWARMIELCAIEQKNWADLSKKDLEALTQMIGNCELKVAGKSTFKEEFVTCGGVRLNEVNFKTMESKVLPHLYFAGEILNIDGVTGGFNFQAAWTTAWVAASGVFRADS